MRVSDFQCLQVTNRHGAISKPRYDGSGTGTSDSRILLHHYTRSPLAPTLICPLSKLLLVLAVPRRMSRIRRRCPTILSDNVSFPSEKSLERKAIGEVHWSECVRCRSESRGRINSVNTSAKVIKIAMQDERLIEAGSFLRLEEE